MNEEVPIDQKSSEQLAAIVVAYRLLGVHKKEAILCMSELLRRKETGDAFDYEKYIQEELNKSPKIPPVGNILKKKGLQSQIASIFQSELQNARKDSSK